MTPETHSQMANFIWKICDLLRGPYKRNEYRRVILPLTVLRRFDCILAPTKQQVLAEHTKLKGKSENIVFPRLCAVSGVQFYNLSKLSFENLLADPNQLAPNLNGYINGFSKNVRVIMQRFDFSDDIRKMAEKNLLYEVVKQFKTVDLSPAKIDNMQMGYIFEELIRIGAEQSNEEAGEHFTPREVIRLMVNLLLSPETDLAKSHVVKKIYDPACGTGGMLSEAQKYLRDMNDAANPILYGQDWNDGAWAVCRSDMLIKGNEADNIKLGCSFTEDGFKDETYDYMLANPPFGVSWKQQQRYIDGEKEKLGFDGRFGAGTPRVNDGALLFLQHMISKMQSPKDGGSRVGIVFNGSPLFTGDAGPNGESSIRQWIIENDWLEAIVALPEQLFYNTGISTYIWIITNRKTKDRKGKIQLVDARDYWIPMKKSLGKKRRQIGDGEDGRRNDIAEISRIFGGFKNDEARTFTIDGIDKTKSVSKIFDNDDFGYHKITVERPLRLNFQATSERIEQIAEESTFQNLTTSKKKNEKIRQKEIAAGKQRQRQILELLAAFAKASKEQLYKDRIAFLKDLKKTDLATKTKLTAAELKAIISALSERDETAEICTDRKGNAEADADLRDTEIVPLKEDIGEYFKREVLPHVPDAWIDEAKTKVGYEIPLNRHFYTYEPPRPLEAIETDLEGLETDIVRLLNEVTA